MICDYDGCDRPSRSTLRIKTASGQWEMLAHSCEEHLAASVAAVREARGNTEALQCIPFRASDWLAVT
jgi:hypothetical protein